MSCLISSERCHSSWEEHGTSLHYKSLVRGRIRTPKTARPSNYESTVRTIRPTKWTITLAMLDLDNLAHNWCPWPKGTKCPWLKVIRGQGHSALIRNTCLGLYSLLPFWIWIFSTIVVHGPKGVSWFQSSKSKSQYTLPYWIRITFQKMFVIRPWSKRVFWPWTKVMSPRLMPQCTHSQISCLGHTSLIISNNCCSGPNVPHVR